MYFFNKNKLKYANGSRPSRKARDGFWKASTTKTLIKDGGGKEIGLKMLLNYRNNSDRNKNTDWLMYEYTIGSDSTKVFLLYYNTKHFIIVLRWHLCVIRPTVVVILILFNIQFTDG